jgi:hypothetical protein
MMLAARFLQPIVAVVGPILTVVGVVGIATILRPEKSSQSIVGILPIAKSFVTNDENFLTSANNRAKYHREKW